jgi:hypothetical protein
MSVFAFGSAKGSPGVTTSVLALAAGWPAGRRVLVVECDPDGGDVASWLRLASEPGLVTYAAQARRQLQALSLWDHTQQLPGPGRIPVLVAPVAAGQTRAALTALGPAELGAALTGLRGVDVLVDCGRVGPGSPLGPLLGQASVTVLVTRPALGQLAHLQALVAALDDGACAAVLLIGDRPYGPTEIATALSAPVAGVLDVDPRGAATLCDQHGGLWTLARSGLLRSARHLARHLVTCTGAEQPGVSQPRLVGRSGPRPMAGAWR